VQHNPIEHDSTTPDIIGSEESKNEGYMFKSKAISYFFVFGFSVTILSIPFFWGLMRPVFDTRNPFTVIYGFLNFPVQLLFKGLINSIAETIWDNPTMSQVDIVSVDIGVMFWALVGYIVGLFGDFRRGVRN
jgi:hypothetical protein